MVKSLNEMVGKKKKKEISSQVFVNQFVCIVHFKENLKEKNNDFKV